MLFVIRRHPAELALKSRRVACSRSWRSRPWLAGLQFATLRQRLLQEGRWCASMYFWNGGPALNPSSTCNRSSSAFILFEEGPASLWSCFESFNGGLITVDCLFDS